MKKIFYLTVIAILFAGCSPQVEIIHSPVIATSSEQVTFTATVVNDGDSPSTVEILVNAAPVQTCAGLSTGDTCTYTGGPYTAYEGTTVSYLANITDSDGSTDSRGYYYFAITDASYNWAFDWITARRTGSTADKEDLVFHRTSDYSSFGDFVDDVGDKMYDVYKNQEIIKDPDNFDTFNVYVYTKTATTGSCGTVDSDADTDMPWRDDDAILHVANFQDCTNLGLTHFTAEGSNTKAFLHESGHAVLGMADEYDGPTSYFQPPDQPNIWDIEADCRAEQTAQSRDPDDCWQFTSRQGGWWGTHLLTDGNVMQVGNAGDPWGTEAEEHVQWYFNQF
jgi:hypothetical protein